MGKALGFGVNPLGRDFVLIQLYIVHVYPRGNSL